jgi:hypothetical protein
VKPFSRKGLHRLECALCDGYSYATVATLERRGLAPCWCGEPLYPAELELALHLGGCDASPVVRDYEDRAARKHLGQKPAQVRASRAGKDPAGLADMDARARAEVSADRRARAAGRRRGALLARHASPVEAMPF